MTRGLWLGSNNPTQAKRRLEWATQALLGHFFPLLAAGKSAAPNDTAEGTIDLVQPLRRSESFSERQVSSSQKRDVGGRIIRPLMSESEEVTMLLSALTKGEDGAASKLMPVVYAELRRLAGSYMRRERKRSYFAGYRSGA